MATYYRQYSSGSATAAGDRGAQGIVTTAAVGINPTHLAYGWYAVDASGRMWVTGTLGVTGNVGISAGTVTAFISAGSGLSATVSGNVSATQVTSPWIVSGNVSATQVTSPWVVSGSAGTWNISAYVSGSATVSGNVSATQVGTWSVSGTALTAYVSGQVSAVQTTSPWVVSAGITGGSLTAFVSGTATISGNVTATLASSVQAFTFASATAAAQQGFQHYYLISSGGTSGVNGANEGKLGFATVNTSGHMWVTITGGQVTAIISGTASVQSVTAQAGAPAGITVSTATGGSLVTIIAGNANRKGVIITNNSTGKLFLGYTTVVSASGPNMGLLVNPGGNYSDFGFNRSTGIIYGVYSTATASQNVSVSEWT